MRDTLTLNDGGNKMDVGDKVEVVDGSYSTEIGGSGIIHTLGSIVRDNSNRVTRWEVIAIDCRLPTQSCCGGEPDGINDTIIQCGGRAVFAQKRFLKVICPTCECTRHCPTCGKKR